MSLPMTPFACLVLGIVGLWIAGYTFATTSGALLAVGVVFALLGLGMLALCVVSRRAGRGWFER